MPETDEVGASEGSASMKALAADVTLDVRVGDLLSTPGASGQDNNASEQENYAEYLKETRKLQRKLLLAQTKKAKQENNLRSKFFNLASRLAIFVIVTSTAALGFYVFKSGSNADPIVLVTWMTAVVVEIIAILQIMAKYLFPGAAAGR